MPWSLVLGVVYLIYICIHIYCIYILYTHNSTNHLRPLFLRNRAENTVPATLFKPQGIAHRDEAKFLGGRKLSDSPVLGQRKCGTTLTSQVFGGFTYGFWGVKTRWDTYTLQFSVEKPMFTSDILWGGAHEDNTLNQDPFCLRFFWFHMGFQGCKCWILGIPHTEQPDPTISFCFFREMDVVFTFTWEVLNLHKFVTIWWSFIPTKLQNPQNTSFWGDWRILPQNDSRT